VVADARQPFLLTFDVEDWDQIVRRRVGGQGLAARWTGGELDPPDADESRVGQPIRFTS
jgi:hypothetical protein